MTHLYRGLLLILTNNFQNLIAEFRKQIRANRPTTSSPDYYLDVGVLGFWNLMLEVVITLFMLVCITSGIVLVATLAIVSYPFMALLTFSAKLLFYTRHPQLDPETKEWADPILNDSPVIVKKEKK